MKKITKLTLLTVAIAACFAACTKDNSVKTSQSSVNFSSKGATALKHDTITPQFTRRRTAKDTITPSASPQVSRDTITPR